MKTNLAPQYVLTIFYVSILLIVPCSCSSDDLQLVNFEGTMSAKINGVTFTAKQAFAFGEYDMDKECYKIPFIKIQGDSYGKVLTLGISDTQGVGTYYANGGYVIHSGYFSTGYHQTHSCDEELVMEPGDVVITSKDGGRIKGTFSFRAFHKNILSCEGSYINVTEGVFDISRINEWSCN